MNKNNKKELTYKDFKEGQKVTCTSVEDFYEQHLTVGKTYKIIDLDFHFPDTICIKTDSNKTGMFIPIKFFTDEKELIRITREKKLIKITREKKQHRKNK